MISLRLKGDFEEEILIEKSNKIKIINYKKYIDIYKYFYLKENLYIEKRQVTKKDTVFLDLSSVANILKELDYTNKKSIIYEYITTNYSNIDISSKDIFYNSFLEQIQILKNNLSLDLTIEPSDTIDKVVIQNIDINIDYENITNIINKILNYIMKYNITKTYIIFYNSQLCSFAPESDNYYLFDINPFNNPKEYNILITDELQNFDFNKLTEYLENTWPVSYIDGEISNLLDNYLSYGIHKLNFITNNERLYLTAVLVNKIYKLNQNIYCNKLIMDSIIKSFIDKI